MDSKFKGRIKSALRKLTRGWTPIRDARKEAKRAAATFECAECKYWCYEGSSEGNYEKLVEANPDELIKKSSIREDHIDPIVSVKEGFIDWNTYIDRMFCSADNFQILCKPCHDIKTKQENKERREWKKLRN